MNDTFDDWWGDDAAAEPGAVATGDRPMLPDGEHVGKIVVAEVKNLDFKVSDSNPTGKSLVVKIAVNGYQLAEDIVPVQLRGVIEAICRSAGIERPAKGETHAAFCERLRGQSAPVDATHVIAPSGREYVRLKWLPGVKPLPAALKAETRTAPKAKPAKAAPPADEFPDDIPF